MKRIAFLKSLCALGAAIFINPIQLFKETPTEFYDATNDLWYSHPSEDIITIWEKKNSNDGFIMNFSTNFYSLQSAKEEFIKNRKDVYYTYIDKWCNWDTKKSTLT